MTKTNNVIPSPGEGGRDGVEKTDNVRPAPGEGPRETDPPPPAQSPSDEGTKSS